MPTLPIGLGGTGKSSFTPNSVLMVSADGTTLTEASGPTEGYVLGYVGGKPQWIQVTTSTPTTNVSPTVAAGNSQGVVLPTTSATLTATASDSDGTIEAYQWTQTLGPNTATITSPTSATTTVTGLIEGVYTFKIQVTDNEGGTANASTQVTVTAQSTAQFTTTINSWNAAVKLPDTYYTDSTDTTYPVVIFFPGLGEVGTNIDNLLLHGPNHQIQQGWDGTITKLDSTTIQPIFVSLQPPTAYPGEATVNTRIATVLATWRCDTNQVHLTGPSQGGWIAETFVTGDSYGGPYTYAGQITSVVAVQAVKPDDNTPYPNLFDNFALSGGKWLGFEQVNDGRDMTTIYNRMNATVVDSAYYVSTSFGDGTHCCFDSFYDETATFSIDGTTQTMYQWMMDQSKAPVVVNQTAAFNFNATAQNVSEWNDVTGQAYSTVISVTDSLGSGITVSSMSTSVWGASGSNTAVAGGESAATGSFPYNVQLQYWFSYNKPYSTNGDNLQISGLTAGATYKIEVLGSRISTAVTQTDRQTAWYVHDANGVQSIENFDVKGNVTPYTFSSCVANSSGIIYMGIAMPPTGNSTNGYQYGYLNGLRITKL